MRVPYYIYKDKFMSGWGMAKRGSYVLTNKPVKRKEFKLLGVAKVINDFKLGSIKDRDVEVWHGVRTPTGNPTRQCKLIWLGKGKGWKIGRCSHSTGKLRT
jgi:hypothetical protein